MFGVNKRRRPAPLLDFGNRMQGQGGFAGRFGAINFHYAAAGIATARGGIERQRARANGFDLHLRGLSEPHDTAPAVGAFNLIQHAIQGGLFGGCLLSINVVVFFVVIGRNGVSSRFTRLQRMQS